MAHQSRRAQILWRYGIVSFFITLLAFGIVYKLIDTTIIHAPQWNEKAGRILQTTLYVQPKRGDILACDGTVLATTLTKYDISLDYRAMARYDTLFVKKIDSLSMALAKAYPRRTVQEWKTYLGAPLAKKPSERKRSHMLLKQVNYADYLDILEMPFFKNFKRGVSDKYKHGLCCNPREVRIMPYGSMARRSIGKCSKVPTPKFEGASRRADSVDVLHGYSGLEYALDSLLFGTVGTAQYITHTKGLGRQLIEAPQDGQTLVTTIDINMQDIVETELQAMLETTGADWGTCLLMEVATGDIKAISNLELDKQSGKYIEAMNYAVRGYEPGSVMKPISMVVALEDKLAPLNKVYKIGRSYAYAGGSPISDTHSPGELPMSRFIEYSSNIGMTKLITPAFENNLNGFRERLRELGFFDQYNTGIAGETTPYFPTLDPKAGGRVSLSRMSYGYSTRIPPLYTCAIYNAIANKGKYVKPRLVKEKIYANGKVEKLDVTYVRDSLCSQRNAKAILDMLHSVVYGEGGTAKSLRNKTVTIAGKTGTCRIAYEGVRNPDGSWKVGYMDGHYRLAFCGVFPYEDPKYTCMALISNPSPAYKGAATTSGYVVKNVAFKMYAHGMLDKNSDYNSVTNPGTTPTIYACQQQELDAVRSTIGAERVKRIKHPEMAPKGVVPNVLGMGVREALACIEDHGCGIKAHGTGRAIRQTPAAGQPIGEDKTVTVVFSAY